MLTRKQLPKYEFSKQGYEKIVTERKDLDKKRELAVADLAKAREMGDLSENGYYKAARAKLSAIDSRIRRLDLMIKYTVVRQNQKTGEIGFGSQIEVEVNNKQLCFEIVGKEEADPDKGKISNMSPIGLSLMGKRVGEKIIFRGNEWEVLNIK